MTTVKTFLGLIYDIESEYNSFLKSNQSIEILSTAITQDFSSYKKENHFIFIVTYKIK